MLLSNLFVFYHVMYVWTYYNERFVNKRDLKSEIHIQDGQVLEQKQWKLKVTSATKW